jgi:hypothetical protein
MCPFCLATAAWIAVGAASTGGISAAVVHTLRKSRQPGIEMTRIRPTAERDGSKERFEENRYVARRIHTQ